MAGRLQKSLSTSADGTDAGGGGAAAAGSADVGGSVAPADSVTWCRTTASYRLALSAPRAAGPLFEIERQHPLFEFERKAADWPEVRAEGAPSSAEQGTASAAAAASGTASLPADPPVDPPAAGAASRQLLAPGSYAGGASPANSVQLLLGGSVSALLQNEASSGADSKVGATSDGGSTSSDGSGTAAGRGVASAANHPCDTSDSGRLLDGAMSGSAPSSGTQGAGGALGGVHSTASVSSWEELRPHLRRCVQRLLHDGGGGRASGEARVAQQGTLPIAGELEALIDALRAALRIQGRNDSVRWEADAAASCTPCDAAEESVVPAAPTFGTADQADLSMFRGTAGEAGAALRSGCFSGQWDTGVKWAAPRLAGADGWCDGSVVVV
eukprot:352913-Chlamydomonas_euryale.AAC.2